MANEDDPVAAAQQPEPPLYELISVMYGWVAGALAASLWVSDLVFGEAFVPRLVSTAVTAIALALGVAGAWFWREIPRAYVGQALCGTVFNILFAILTVIGTIAVIIYDAFAYGYLNHSIPIAFFISLLGIAMSLFLVVKLIHPISIESIGLFDPADYRHVLKEMLTAIDNAAGTTVSIVVCTGAIFGIAVAVSELVVPGELTRAIIAELPTTGTPLPPGQLVRAGCVALILGVLLGFCLAARTRRLGVLLWTAAVMAALSLVRLIVESYHLANIAPAPMIEATLGGTSLAVALLCLVLRKRSHRPWE